MLVHVIQVRKLNIPSAYTGQSGFKSESAMRSTMKGYCDIIRSMLQMGARAYFLFGQVCAKS
ncbi:MAG: hypothetical protein ABI076_03515 [Acidobacteriaceae bacterium]